MGGSHKGQLEEQVAALVQSLPPLDDNVAALLQAAVQPAPDTATLVQRIGSDSGLCATLLSLANSTCWSSGGSVPFETIRESLERIGVEALATAVGASAALRTVGQELELPPKQWQDYLKHSREISAVCTLLSEGLGHPQPERDMFTAAGLTHDVGRVVMFAAARNATASMLGTRPDAMARVIADEQTAYGLDHCRIGYSLFRRWGFSDTMQQGVLRHHSPLMKDDYSFPGALIFVAHFVTMSDLTGEIISRMLPAELLRRLGLRSPDLDRARSAYAGRRGQG